jgi:hypothetical protein
VDFLFPIKKYPLYRCIRQILVRFFIREHKKNARSEKKVSTVFKSLFVGSYILLWRRGTSVLTAASLMVTRDTRFRLVDGYNLQIGNVRIQDAGKDRNAVELVNLVE